MRALVVSRGKAVPTTLELSLDESFLGDEGDVTVDVEYSSINYKDALAITGRPGVVRVERLIPGIDLVGTVASSSSPGFSTGDRVLVNGCGLGETHNGGLGERARVSADWLVRVPESISQQQAAAIGTAGFTAMLAILELERDGVDGEVLVTGAAGGVGSIAIAILARLGYSVTASTGRASTHDYLRSLGATTIIDRLGEAGKPLQEQRWAGVIESVGGSTLSNALSQTKYGGTVAALGNAQAAEFTSSVYPFILRAVRLAGINSVYTPRPLRLAAWDRLGRDLDLGLLDAMTTVVPLEGAMDAALKVIEGSVHGRIVVDTGP